MKLDKSNTKKKYYKSKKNYKKIRKTKKKTNKLQRGSAKYYKYVGEKKGDGKFIVKHNNSHSEFEYSVPNNDNKFLQYNNFKNIASGKALRVTETNNNGKPTRTNSFLWKKPSELKEDKLKIKKIPIQKLQKLKVNESLLVPTSSQKLIINTNQNENVYPINEHPINEHLLKTQKSLKQIKVEALPVPIPVQPPGSVQISRILNKHKGNYYRIHDTKKWIHKNNKKTNNINSIQQVAAQASKVLPLQVVTAAANPAAPSSALPAALPTVAVKSPIFNEKTDVSKLTPEQIPGIEIKYILKFLETKQLTKEQYQSLTEVQIKSILPENIGLLINSEYTASLLTDNQISYLTKVQIDKIQKDHFLKIWKKLTDKQKKKLDTNHLMYIFTSIMTSEEDKLKLFDLLEKEQLAGLANLADDEIDLINNESIKNKIKKLKVTTPASATSAPPEPSATSAPSSTPVPERIPLTPTPAPTPKSAPRPLTLAAPTSAPRPLTPAPATIEIPQGKTLVYLRSILVTNPLSIIIQPSEKSMRRILSHTIPFLKRILEREERLFNDLFNNTSVDLEDIKTKITDLLAKIWFDINDLRNYEKTSGTQYYMQYSFIILCFKLYDFMLVQDQLKNIINGSFINELETEWIDKYKYLTTDYSRNTLINKISTLKKLSNYKIEEKINTCNVLKLQSINKKLCYKKLITRKKLLSFDDCKKRKLSFLKKGDYNYVEIKKCLTEKKKET